MSFPSTPSSRGLPGPRQLSLGRGAPDSCPRVVGVGNAPAGLGWPWRSGEPQDCTDKRVEEGSPGKTEGHGQEKREGLRRLKTDVQSAGLHCPQTPASAGEKFPKAFSCQENRGVMLGRDGRADKDHASTGVQER